MKNTIWTTRKIFSFKKIPILRRPKKNFESCFRLKCSMIVYMLTQSHKLYFYLTTLSDSRFGFAHSKTLAYTLKPYFFNLIIEVIAYFDFSLIFYRIYQPFWARLNKIQDKFLIYLFSAFLDFVYIIFIRNYKNLIMLFCFTYSSFNIV